jgi:hypothetical protein
MLELKIEHGVEFRNTHTYRGLCSELQQVLAVDGALGLVPTKRALEGARLRELLVQMRYGMLGAAGLIKIK